MAKNTKLSDNKVVPYQDFVIRDGVYIGQFEEMYQSSTEIPWHQDITVDAIFSDITVTILKHYCIESALDVGCGLGYMTDRLRREIPTLNYILGIDISETAISKARKMFTSADFSSEQISDIANRSEKFDVVISKDVLWYVLGQLPQYIKSVSSVSKKWIYFGQSFPENRPFYGEETFPDANALVRYFEDSKFKVKYSLVEKDSKYSNREYAHILVEVVDDK